MFQLMLADLDWDGMKPFGLLGFFGWVPLPLFLKMHAIHLGHKSAILKSWQQLF